MALPRDGDGDGWIYDGTPEARPLGARPPGDVRALRAATFDRALEAVRGLAAENDRYALRLADVDYVDPEEPDPARERRAILAGESLARRIRGAWELVEKATGAVVARKEATVVSVPYWTDRGTWVRRGLDYSVASQQRLRPSVFVRRRSSGELEAHVNVLPGEGLGGRVLFEPESGRFSWVAGSAKVPLLLVLRALGGADDEAREAWGRDLVAANSPRDTVGPLRRLHEKLYRGRPPQGALEEEVRKALERTPVDPDVTARTLGRPHAAITKDLLLDTTRKVLAAARGEPVEDDRDSLANLAVWGPEDLLAERLRRSFGLLGKALWKATRTGTLDHVGPGLLEPQVEALVAGSGLAQPGEGVNQIALADQLWRVTRKGTGGIAGDAIPESARAVHPSQYGYIDTVVTPESGAVGVDGRMAFGTLKGRDGRLYTRHLDARTGREVYLAPQDTDGKAVALPGELEKGEPTVAVVRSGKLDFVPRGEVDYVLPRQAAAFSPTTNLVPLASTIKPQRAVMAQRMIAQALPLVRGESPLVRNALPGRGDDSGRPFSFDELAGRTAGAVRAEEAGTVVDVRADRIRLRTDDGRTIDRQLYNHLPSNLKTGLHQTPVVAPGQRVEPGQLLARSNQTDAEGALALGLNARVAWIPNGFNYEDALVVSESFARRAASDHYYQPGLELDGQTRLGKGVHAMIFPGTYTREQLERYTEEGLPRPGAVLEPGDPVVLAVRKREPRHGMLHRGRSPGYADATVTWDHDHPGEVVEAVRGRRGVNVVVRTTAPLVEGDKLAGRQGNKGIVARILPDDQMPQDEAGRPFEVLFNPLGLISRVNPAQVLESQLGRIAEKLGRPIAVEDFKTGRDATRWVLGELRRHGLSPRTSVVDPQSGRRIDRVLSGPLYVMKLVHQAEAKEAGRGTGSYTSDDSPAKGGPEGSKKFSVSDLAATLSHGATSVIRDAGVVRGQANPDYWAQVMAGHTPPLPKVPLVYEKYLATLKGAGLNVVPEGRKLRLTALTRQAIDELAGDRDLENAETLDLRTKELRPVRGGLFDDRLGGPEGRGLWGAIRLAEPLPSPAFERPIRDLLGLTEPAFRDVLAGRAPLEGRTGPHAVRQALEAIDLDQALARARDEARHKRGAARDRAIRNLGVLRAAKERGIHPGDWVWPRVPVLPPAFRPVNLLAGSKVPMVADANVLYKELFEADRSLRALSGKLDDVGDERLAVYDALKAVVGLGEPIQPESRQREVKGLLKAVFGSSPKHGFVQKKLLGSTVDLVGRAVIAPDPELDLDQIALPEGRAWDVYRPLVVRRLRRMGVDPLRALEETENRSPLARRALDAEMASRPVLASRAPVLHRYSVMAFRPVLAPGHTMRLNPLVYKGFGADNDGDMMNYSVVMDDDAAAEAFAKMLPSANLRATSDFRVHQLPQQEFVAGLYLATTLEERDKPPLVFDTAADALRAFRRGEIGLGRRVRVREDNP